VRLEGFLEPVDLAVLLAIVPTLAAVFAFEMSDAGLKVREPFPEDQLEEPAHHAGVMLMPLVAGNTAAVGE